MTELELSRALCYTEHRQSAHLWDEDLDASTRSARAETNEQRQRRHDEAKAICRRCPEIDPCRVLGLHPEARGVYGGVLV